MTEYHRRVGDIHRLSGERVGTAVFQSLDSLPILLVALVAHEDFIRTTTAVDTPGLVARGMPSCILRQYAYWPIYRTERSLCSTVRANATDLQSQASISEVSSWRGPSDSPILNDECDPTTPSTTKRTRGNSYLTWKVSIFVSGNRGRLNIRLGYLVLRDELQPFFVTS
jgi:hypothetical protein